jgi:hypothetical protein
LYILNIINIIEVLMKLKNFSLILVAGTLMVSQGLLAADSEDQPQSRKKVAALTATTLAAIALGGFLLGRTDKGKETINKALTELNNLPTTIENTALGKRVKAEWEELAKMKAEREELAKMKMKKHKPLTEPGTSANPPTN